jgi:DNA-binding NtrC family response regulator
MKGQFLGLVIIIDDDKDICDLLAHLLEHAGYETQQAYDGLSAIKLLSQFEPDVLLLDMVIPEPDGMTVLAKARILYPLLPVIIITGKTGSLNDISEIKAIAFDYIPKSFYNNGILKVVNRAMQTTASNLNS